MKKLSNGINSYFVPSLYADELTDAYAELSKLIKEYLSLNVPKCDESSKSLDDERWQMSSEFEP